MSHDLRTPLRSIDGFSHALEEEMAGSLNEQASDYLRRVRKAAQRMGKLIDDLIGMSRVSLMDIRVETIDLSVMAKEVYQELTDGDKFPKVQFDCEVGLLICADAKLIRLVLVNLLENALKYSAQAQSPVISLSTMTVNNESVFYVRDNGVGFDAAYTSKLFAPFQRLHGAEFEGTGIGLATVARILARHAGKIWAESEPGSGATFYFTIGRP